MEIIYHQTLHLSLLTPQYGSAPPLSTSGWETVHVTLKTWMELWKLTHYGLNEISVNVDNVNNWIFQLGINWIFCVMWHVRTIFYLNPTKLIYSGIWRFCSGTLFWFIVVTVGWNPPASSNHQGLYFNILNTTAKDGICNLYLTNIKVAYSGGIKINGTPADWRPRTSQHCKSQFAFSIDQQWKMWQRIFFFLFEVFNFFRSVNFGYGFRFSFLNCGNILFYFTNLLVRSL